MNHCHVELSGVGIEFPGAEGSFRALDKVDLKIVKGEFISLIGHSGCGKSTILNIIAGLLKATDGGCIVAGREVDEPGAIASSSRTLPFTTVTASKCCTFSTTSSAR